MRYAAYPEHPRYFVDALGVRTGYYAAGAPNGRPALLLHGMSTSADSFRETMHALAAEHWLIAPDIPGFGYSQHTRPYTMNHLVEWLAALQHALDLPPLLLVGHSFGSTIATSFTLSYPQQVTRLLLLAPALLSAAAYPDVMKKLGVSLGLIDLGTAVSQSRAWLNRQIRAPFYDPDKQDPSLWQRRLHDYQLARASADVLKMLAFYDAPPLLPQLTHPVCIVFGDNDPVVPPADGDKLLALLPQAQLHRLPQCGHAPMLEQQEAFQTIAREFLS
ncbi:MAG: alpha/beta hydrolase [Anaerolinea sp.]|nr:alpha/beta hydrolase [Anaerolinea sp.]